MSLASIILHAIFGLAGFGGSIMTIARFSEEKENLSALTKVGMMLAYVGTAVSSVLGFASATNNNPIVIGGLSLAAVVFAGVAFFRPAKAVKEQ